MAAPFGMANPIRNMVSKQRIRYTKNGFNLDLTYITGNLIAMGFPAEKLEGIYRNHIDEVARMLDTNHKDHYKIYNLCSERSYDPCKFQQRVAAYPFNDHNPPKIELIQEFCRDVHEWLSADPMNVAAVHCKAGKGRTGTMICCYLLYSRRFRTADDALRHYGIKRAYDQKGVTIPSQRRYVEYYATLLDASSSERAGSSPVRDAVALYKPPTLLILELTMGPPPVVNGGQGALELCVSAANCASQKASVALSEVRKGSPFVRLRLDRCTPLVGDVKVEVNNKSKLMGKEKLFHFWFNTFFVRFERSAVAESPYGSDGPNLSVYKLTFNKWQLDDAHKDTQNKTFSSDFAVELTMQRVPENSNWGRRTTSVGASAAAAPASSSSSAEEESETEEGWDSGESTYL